MSQNKQVEQHNKRKQNQVTTGLTTDKLGNNNTRKLKLTKKLFL